MEKATLAQGQELLKLVSQSCIEKNDLQALLESGDFTTLLRKYMQNIITRSIRVDRTRTPQSVIGVFAGSHLVLDACLKDMPACGDGIENNVEVIFFRLGHKTNNDELAREYWQRGLKPDPYAVAAVNEADPKFVSNYLNGTHWKDAKGKWVFLSFQLNYDVLIVYCHDHANPDIDWWFGGVRK